MYGWMHFLCGHAHVLRSPWLEPAAAQTISQAYCVRPHSKPLDTGVPGCHPPRLASGAATAARPLASLLLREQSRPLDK
jgi:hypothetical protein